MQGRSQEEQLRRTGKGEEKINFSICLHTFALPCTYVQFQHSTNCVALVLYEDRDGDDDVDVDGHDAEGFFYINSSVLLNINVNTRKYKPEGIPQDCWSLQGQGFLREEQLPRTRGSARRGLSSKSRWP